MRSVSDRYILKTIGPKKQAIEAAINAYSNGLIDVLREDITYRQLNQIEKRKEKETQAQFTLESLAGKTIQEVRRIKNTKKTRRRSTEKLDVLIFSDETFLVNEKWGDLECGHIDSYFYNGKKVLYSSRLFGDI